MNHLFTVILILLMLYKIKYCFIVSLLNKMVMHVFDFYSSQFHLPYSRQFMIHSKFVKQRAFPHDRSGNVLFCYLYFQYVVECIGNLFLAFGSDIYTIM